MSFHCKKCVNSFTNKKKLTNKNIKKYITHIAPCLEVVYPSDADGSLPMVHYTEHRRVARRDISTGAALQVCEVSV